MAREYGQQPPSYTPAQPTGLPENWGSGGGGGGGGSDNYNDLSNKPKINGVVVQGEKTAQQLGLASSYAAEVLATIPTSPTARQTVQYVGEDDGDFIKGNIYRYSGTAWVCIYEQPEAGEVESIPIEDIDGLFE